MTLYHCHIYRPLDVNGIWQTKGLKKAINGSNAQLAEVKQKVVIKR